jgi:hypothetical protein
MLKEVQILLATESRCGYDVIQWQLAPFYAQPSWVFIACDRILCRLYVGIFINSEFLTPIPEERMRRIPNPWWQAAVE